jgi:hypothetical protein
MGKAVEGEEKGKNHKQSVLPCLFRHILTGILIAINRETKNHPAFINAGWSNDKSIILF